MNALFVVPDIGPGCGIPAEEINLSSYILKRKGLWKQSDGTIHLGFYLAMLATEYKRLSLQRQSTQSTVDDLYYALNAVWRLDIHSGFYAYDPCIMCNGPQIEVRRKKPCTGKPICTLDDCYVCDSCPDNPNFTLQPGAPSSRMTGLNYQDSLLDGFLIRSDAGCSFAARLRKHNPIFKNVIVSSDLLTPYGNEGRNKEMSQDQAIFMLMGLYTIAQCLDPIVEKNGVPLRAFAIEEANRIVLAMRGKNWVLINPSTNEKVKRGDARAGYAYGKSKMGDAILPDSTYEDDPKIRWYTRLIWQIQRNPHFTGARINAAMDGAMASVGNSWGRPGKGKTGKALWAYAQDQGLQLPLYYLLFAVFHPEDKSLEKGALPEQVQKIYAKMLQMAPDTGITSPWPNGKRDRIGWDTHNRFIGGLKNKAENTLETSNLKNQKLRFEEQTIAFTPKKGSRKIVTLNGKRSRRKQAIYDDKEMVLKVRCTKDFPSGEKYKLTFKVNRAYMGKLFSANQQYSGIDFMLLYNLYWLATEGRKKTS